MKKANLFLSFALFIITLYNANGQQLSASAASLIEFAKVSTEELSGLTDVKNSAGYQLGIFYEIPLREKISIETGVNFGYGRLNHVTTLDPADFDIPWEAHINSPQHFVKGICPLNILFSQNINARYRMVYKAGFYYQGIYVTEPLLSSGIGAVHENIRDYRFETKDAVKHSVGNSFAVGAGRKFVDSSEMHINLIFGFTYNKPVRGEVAFMPGSEEEIKGELYKTGTFAGLELRYYLKQNNK